MSNETHTPPAPPWVPKWGRGIYTVVIGDRDIGVMLIVATLLYTVNVIGTIGAMRYLLPPEAAVFSGFLIVTIIFLAEAKYIARHAPFIRKLVVIVFIPVTVLAMHSSYYNLGAALRDAGTAVSHASSPYSDLVNSVYAPNKAIADSLMRRADEKYAASERERTSGSGTGKTGYGPRAQALQREGDELRDDAAPYLAKLDPMRPYAELDPAAIGPEKTYEAALSLWRVTPEEWKTLPASECEAPPCSIPKPTREEFVDEASESPLLTPMRRAMQGDWLSLLLLALAGGLDGLVLLLGTAIVRTDEPATDTRSLVHRVADGFVGARQARKTLQYARSMPVEHIDIRDPLRTMHVRVVGERHSADFWNLLYRHTHPLSGRFDWAGILHHENESYKDMARWWIDAARANGLLVDTGAEDENEALYYPKDSYYPTTNFYREMHLREINHRDQLPDADPNAPVERVMRVLLPEPIRRKPDEPVELMRPLPSSASKLRTAAVAPTTVATGPAPHTAIAGPVAAIRSATPAARASNPVTTARSGVVAVAPRPRVTIARRAAVSTEPVGVPRGVASANPATMERAPTVIDTSRVVVAPQPVVVSDDRPAVVAAEPPVSSTAIQTRADTTILIDGGDEDDDVLEDTDPSVLAPSPVEDLEEIEPEPLEDVTLEMAPPPEPEPDAALPEAPSVSPEPLRVLPQSMPDLNPDDWEDRPTGATLANRPRPRELDELVLHNDALRHGQIIAIAYLTNPPPMRNAVGDPFAPAIRGSLKSLMAGGRA